MRILLIGGSGFIGGHFARTGIARGHHVTIVSRKAASEDSIATEWISGGIEALVENPSALAEADIICHFASTSVPATADADPATDVSQNLALGLKMLETMRSVGSKRILYLSSGGAVYGQAQYSPIDEGHPLAPLSSYGIVKMAMERYLALYADSHGFEPLIVRPANPYGPGQQGSRQFGLIATMIGIARNGGAAQIFGDGSIVRDFIYIDDLCSLLWMGIETGLSGVYNAGSGRGASINEIVNAVERTSGRPMERRHLPARAIDPPEVVLDISRARRDFNWEPLVPLAQGIDLTWKASSNGA